jgi:ribosomal protein S27AE
MKVVSLKCVNCGASLEIGPHVDNFACGYCGTKQRVDRGGGIVSLRKIETTLSEVRQATDRTASELALVRLQGDLSSLPTGRRSEGTSSC